MVWRMNGISNNEMPLDPQYKCKFCVSQWSLSVENFCVLSTCMGFGSAVRSFWLAMLKGGLQCRVFLEKILHSLGYTNGVLDEFLESRIDYPHR